jgi:hypothetical protein
VCSARKKYRKFNFINADKNLFSDIRKIIKIEKSGLKSFGERFTDGFPFWCVFDQVFQRNPVFGIWKIVTLENVSQYYLKLVDHSPIRCFFGDHLIKKCHTIRKKPNILISTSSKVQSRNKNKK